MPPIVYLIGVDHIVQHINEKASQAKRRLVFDFTHHLLEVAQAYHVTLLAEEFSEEALVKSHATSTIAQNVANKLGIEHRFCDPSSVQRGYLGIQKPDNEKRERYWLRCLRLDHHDKIIFVCGNNHIRSFADLLITEGFHVHLISSDWGLNFVDSPFSE